jgi:U6 snRNA-associated Sm-like protein LSm7
MSANAPATTTDKPAAAAAAPAAAAAAKKVPNKKGLIFLDLNKFVNQSIRVKFTGGREVVGILKGYDQLVNLVLDESIETLRDPYDPTRVTEKTRSLGLTVCRGTSVMLIAPEDGTLEIENPFAAPADGEQPLV